MNCMLSGASLSVRLNLTSGDSKVRVFMCRASSMSLRGSMLAMALFAKITVSPFRSYMTTLRNVASFRFFISMLFIDKGMLYSSLILSVTKIARRCCAASNLSARTAAMISAASPAKTIDMYLSIFMASMCFIVCVGRALSVFAL